METKHILGFLAGIIVLVGGVAFLASRNETPGISSPYDLQAFTQCLKDSGAEFYGAFWCSHCRATKELFGDAKDNLPYIECSTPDTKGQLPICKEKNIESYPTWIFADGSRLLGEVTFEQLSEKTSCPLNLKDQPAQ